MGLKDTSVWGFDGRTPFLGVFGGHFGVFMRRTPPQMGLRDSSVWGFEGGPHFGGFLGVNLGVL